MAVIVQHRCHHLVVREGGGFRLKAPYQKNISTVGYIFSFLGKFLSRLGENMTFKDFPGKVCVLTKTGTRPGKHGK